MKFIFPTGKQDVLPIWQAHSKREALHNNL